MKNDTPIFEAATLRHLGNGCWTDNNGFQYVRLGNGPFRLIESAKPSLIDDIKRFFVRPKKLKYV